MNQYEDMFREAFEAHEHLAPKMGAVYLGSQVLYRRYVRRRRSAQVVSGAVLGAGLLAAGSNLPAGLLPGATPAGPPARVGTPTPTPPTPSVRTSLSQAELDQDLDAFDRAGYGHDDAVKLAALWHTTADILYVKAEAGDLLRAGRTLPIPPHPIRDEASSEFLDAGYTDNDARKLAALWRLPGPAEAKAKAGTLLEEGRPLPLLPPETPQRKFWDAGYDVKDAEVLARLWHVSVDDAKVRAGRMLLRGERLPRVGR